MLLSVSQSMSKCVKECSVAVVYLATVNLLYFVQQFVETSLHIITLDLHHVQGGGGGGGGGGPVEGKKGELYQRVISAP